MTWPAVTSSPWLTWVVKPSPFSATVSKPRCTRTPTPSGVSTTKAWGISFRSLPLTGATASITSARRVDGGAVSDHARGEHGVGDVREQDRTPGDRGEN